MSNNGWTSSRLIRDHLRSSCRLFLLAASSSKKYLAGTQPTHKKSIEPWRKLDKISLHLLALLQHLPSHQSTCNLLIPYSTPSPTIRSNNYFTSHLQFRDILNLPYTTARGDSSNTRPVPSRSKDFHRCYSHETSRPPNEYINEGKRRIIILQEALISKSLINSLTVYYFINIFIALPQWTKRN